MQDILDELNFSHEEYVKKTEREILLRNQKIENLQKFISDNKNSIDIIKTQQENYLIEQQKEFENEKEELNEKISKTKKDAEVYEIDINKLKEQNDQMKANIKELKANYNEIEDEIRKAKDELDDQISEMKSDINLVSNNINVNNANYDKELLLKKQNIDFSNKKLEEITNDLNNYKEIFEGKINEAREKIIGEYTDKINDVKKAKENFENMLNKIEKQYNELNTKFENESESLTKEKESVTEKLNDLTFKKRQLGDQLDSQHCNDQTIILKLRSEYKLKNENLSKDNILLREKLQKLEQNYNKLTNNYDNEKSNWENKFVFINQQKELLDKDLEELKNKYNSNMDQLQKKIFEERERLEQIYKKSLLDGDNIHNEQISQAQNTFNKKYEEVNVQNNNLIAENATLTKKIEDYEINNKNAINEIDKKLKDALEQEKKYRIQYDNLKKEKENKIISLKKQIESEKKKNKVKIEELEAKLQEYEGKQNNINTNFIKDKAVNDKNLENKITYIQQLNDTLERLKKENEKLVNENKEIQRENENYRKSSRGSSRNSSNIGTNYIPRRRPRNITSMNINKENLAVNYMDLNHPLSGRDERGANNSSSTLIIPDNKTDTKGILTSLMDDKSVISMNNNNE